MREDPTFDDYIAAMAEKAYPLYRLSNWEWRGCPVTPGDLALCIRRGAEHVLQKADGHTWGTGGIEVERNDEDQEIVVFIRLGEIPMDATRP